MEQISALITTFDDQAPEEVYSHQEEGAFHFFCTLRAHEHFYLGTEGAAGFFHIHSGAHVNSEVTVLFSGVSGAQTLTLPDGSGILAIGNQRLDTNSEVVFENVTCNWIDFNAVGSNADSVFSGDHTVAVGDVLRFVKGCLSAINP